ncbi:MAG TPA: MerR family transcriptional regulator [Chloroflexia bacterium]
MIVEATLRTIDLARAGRISVQQVRNYEAAGLIPPAARGPNGYRRYTRKHLVALTTARALVGSYGPLHAAALMQAVHRGDLPAALALIDARHAELAATRQQVEQTLAALRALAAQPAGTGGAPHGPRLRVGAAARQVGVRVSALRFWEQQGLLLPVRDPHSGYRLYHEPQMRRLRVVVLLRAAGYDFPAIRGALDALAAGRTETAIAAVERRRAELARTSWACLAALGAFQAYVTEFWADLGGAL